MSISLVLFLLFFSAGCCFALIRHPIWGLASYCLTLYASPNHFWWGQSLPAIRWSLLAALITLISVFINQGKLDIKSPWYANGAAKILIAYTLWMWFQFPWALSSSHHLDACVLFTKYCVLFYLIYRILNDDKTIFLFTFFNIIGGLYWGNAIRGYAHSGRVEGIGGPGVNDANTLGMHLSVLLIFSCIMYLKKKPDFINNFYWQMVRIIIVVSALFMANAVVQTISRSAILGLLAASGVLFFRNHRLIRKKVYIFSLIGLMAFFYLVPYTFWDRMGTMKETIEGDNIENSAYSRLVVGLAQIEMFQSHILGAGHRGTQILSPYYISAEYLAKNYSGGEAARSSHCTFLTTLVEQGIPGAILYWLIFFWMIKVIVSFKKYDLSNYLYFLMLSSSLAAIFVSGIFVDYLKVEIQIYCFAMLASLIDYQQRLAYQKLSHPSP